MKKLPCKRLKSVLVLQVHIHVHTSIRRQFRFYCILATCCCPHSMLLALSPWTAQCPGALRTLISRHISSCDVVDNNLFSARKPIEGWKIVSLSGQQVLSRAISEYLHSAPWKLDATCVGAGLQARGTNNCPNTEQPLLTKTEATPSHGWDRRDRLFCQQ